MTQELTTNQMTTTEVGKIPQKQTTSNEVNTKFQSAPSLRNEATDDKHLFRVVDREESWTHYFQDELQKYFPSVNHILGIGFPKGQGLLNWLKNKTAEESDKILKHAGERGSRVHDAIRDLIQGQTLSIQAYYKNEDGSSTPLKIEEWDYLLSWAAWVEKFKPQTLKHETAVYNKKYGYAGTVDFIGSITIPANTKVYVDGKVQNFDKDTVVSVLLDWKTSGSIYDEYKLQVAAYAACMKLKPKQEFYTGIVRLGTKHKNGGYEFHLYSRNKTLEHFKQFLITKDTYHFINGTDWKPEIEQIPLVIKVEVPQLKSNGPTKPNTQRRPNVRGVQKSNDGRPNVIRRSGVKDKHNSNSKSVPSPKINS